jgi:hypothetical protein
MVVAINPVRQPGERRERRQTDMDKLFQALQIANAGMNIAVNYDSFRRRDAQEQRAERGLAVQEATLAENIRSGKAGEEFQREKFATETGLKRRQIAATEESNKLTREAAGRQKQFEFRESFATKKPVAKAVSAYRNLDKVEGLINLGKEQGNSRAIIQGLNNMMRSIGGEVGVATDKDFARTAESKQVAQNLADKFNLWAKGELSDASFEELDAIIGVARQKAAQTIATEADSHVKSGAVLFGNQEVPASLITPHEAVGESEEEFRNVLETGFRTKPEQPPAPPGPPQQTTPFPATDERDAFTREGPTSFRRQEGANIDLQNLEKINPNLDDSRKLRILERARQNRLKKQRGGK